MTPFMPLPPAAEYRGAYDVYLAKLAIQEKEQALANTLSAIASKGGPANLLPGLQVSITGAGPSWAGPSAAAPLALPAGPAAVRAGAAAPHSHAHNDGAGAMAGLNIPFGDAFDDELGTEADAILAALGPGPVSAADPSVALGAGGGSAPKRQPQAAAAAALNGSTPGGRGAADPQGRRRGNARQSSVSRSVCEGVD